MPIAQEGRLWSRGPTWGRSGLRLWPPGGSDFAVTLFVCFFAAKLTVLARTPWNRCHLQSCRESSPLGAKSGFLDLEGCQFSA